MITKYDSCFDEKVVQTDLRRLVNQIWKLLPMREKEEEVLSKLGLSRCASYVMEDDK